MPWRNWHLSLVFCLGLTPWVETLAAAQNPVSEVPYLKQQVKLGQLSSMNKRLPDEPRIITLKEKRNLGQYGGRLRTLMAKEKDIRLITVYGYARLVAYNKKLELVADILKSYEVKNNNRQFTLTLRKGHKWSDGAPFTTEDFRYYWQDIATNDTLSPAGPPKALVVNGRLPKVEILSPYKIRYTWDEPNLSFLPALAAPRPTYIYAPAHYLKQFHIRYADSRKLKKQIKEEKVRNWASLHLRYGHQYKNNNPDLPSLQPWINTTKPPRSRYLFVRNPYYYKTDQLGRQLPYLDEIQVKIVSADLIPAKISANESDLQARYVTMDQWPFLKQGEQKFHDYKVLAWKSTYGSQLAIYPNQNCKNSDWRYLMQNVSFRRALSLGVNRHEINEVIYFGLAKEGANTVLPISPLYEKRFANAWTQFDLKRANLMLDQLGLSERDEEGIRLLPSGKPMLLILHGSSSRANEEANFFELLQSSWRKLGIKVLLRSSQLEVFRRRVTSGEACFSFWQGLDNALLTPDMPPTELAPNDEVQPQWPLWGIYVATNKERGHPASTPLSQKLSQLKTQWNIAETQAERKAIAQKMLWLNSNQVVTIGTANQVVQPVIRSIRLQNLPDVGYYGWQPTSYFGIYQPDTFYFADVKKKKN